VLICYGITVYYYRKGMPEMKKNLFRSGFNLIEVTMAIAIVGIGIAGVMALFPPAIEANKAANNQNYIGTVSDSFLGYLEGNFLHNFVAIKNLPSSKPDTAESWKNKADSAISGFPGLYQIKKSGGFESNIFAVESADGSVNALIAMWQSGAAAPDSYSSDANDSRRVYIEVSWPAAQPYDSRQKKLYVYDVFNE